MGFLKKKAYAFEMKIHHVALIVRDIERSLDFYQNKLGFKLIEKTFRTKRESWKADIRLGEIQLELFTFPEAAVRPTYPEALGLRHLAFSVEKIDEYYEELRGKGVSLEEKRVDQLTGKKFFFFSDPDDQPLEVYEN